MQLALKEVRQFAATPQPSKRRGQTPSQLTSTAKSARSVDSRRQPLETGSAMRGAIDRDSKVKIVNKRKTPPVSVSVSVSPGPGPAAPGKPRVSPVK